MNLQTKKIIAKEFIMLTVVLGIGLLSFTGTYIYNFYLSNKLTKIDESINLKTGVVDSLLKPYNNKIQNQKWFFTKLNDQVDISESYYNSYDKLWTRFEEIYFKDSIKNKFDKDWTNEQKKPIVDIGFETSEKLEAFLKNNLINQSDLKNKQKSVKLNYELSLLRDRKDNTIKPFLDFNAQKEFAATAIIIALIFLFGLRYVYNAIKWSVRTLKQKSTN